MKHLDFEYWPSLSWMDNFYNSNKVMLEQHGNYQKQSLFNRCHIVGRNGPLTLSIPLLGGREQKTQINNLRINNEQNWNIRQLRTLKSCYGKAPFFEYYFPVIETMLMQKHELMIDLNESVLQQIIRWLKWGGFLEKTNSFIYKPKESTTEYEANPYVQVFAGSVSFVPNLSILDALFCMGPQLKDYLVD